MSGSGGDTEVKETDAERALARRSVEQFNHYQDVFAPLENRMIGTTENLTSGANMDHAMGQAGAATEQQFSGARDQLRGNLFDAGFNPSSGGFASRMAGLADNEALSKGMNEANTGQALSDQRAYGLQGLTAIGRGDTTTAFSGYGSQAGSAQNQAVSDARNALNESLATQQTIGTAAGAASAYGLNRMTAPTAGSSTAGLSNNGIAGLTATDAWNNSGMNYGLGG